MGGTIRAGVATVNITPSVGWDNMGDYLRLKPARGVGNELFAKALVLDNGNNTAAIVTADIISFTRKLTDETRTRIEKLTGIPGRSVLLSASHTHSSPAIAEKDRPSAEYLTELSKKIAGAVFLAQQDMREVLIGCGVGKAEVSINRWQRTDSGVKWGPNPDAPVDHEVLVMRIDDLNARPLVILVNFASHPSILGANNLLYSGDYVSYVQSTIEKAYDGRVTAMFTTGAGGDIKIAVLSEDGSQFKYGSLEDCRHYGRIIGAEAIKVAEMIKTKPVRKLSTTTVEVELPFVELPSIEDVKRELESLRRFESEGNLTAEQELNLHWAQNILGMLSDGTAPRTFPAELQLIRIGNDIAFFAVPGELFVEVGMKLKKLIGLSGPFIVAYANGCIGYLPSKRAQEWGWCEHDNSFKFLDRPANFSGEIEDVLQKALITMMSQG